MRIELVGTRAAGMTETATLADRLDPSSGDGIAIASAYWDKHACDVAIDLARRVGGVTRLVLWTAGATRGAWIAAAEAAGSPGLDLRFIESPADGGIFHTKVAGVTATDGAWTCALVGSANLTAAGRTGNVELGVLIRDEAEALGQLRAWFDELWNAAAPAATFDFDTAISIAPERSEAAARKRLFAERALAPHAPAVTAP
jgi:phosphatidylserine/phosphatidylglycerophosphate/cardiolipin synthase-like enzyme